MFHSFSLMRRCNQLVFRIRPIRFIKTLRWMEGRCLFLVGDPRHLALGHQGSKKRPWKFLTKTLARHDYFYKIQELWFPTDEVRKIHFSICHTRVRPGSIFLLGYLHFFAFVITFMDKTFFKHAISWINLQ